MYRTMTAHDASPELADALAAGWEPLTAVSIPAKGPYKAELVWALRRRVTEWISAVNKPTTLEVQLVWATQGELQGVRRGFYSHGRDLVDNAKARWITEDGLNLWGVTHWRPLPPAPTGRAAAEVASAGWSDAAMNKVIDDHAKAPLAVDGRDV